MVLGLTSGRGSSRLAPLFLLVLLTVLQGASLNTSLWAPLCCLLGVTEFLRHVVGWVFRIWCGLTLPSRDGALPAGVRGSGRGASTAAVAVRVVTSVGACGPPMRQALLPVPHVFLLIKSSHPRSEVSAVRPSSQLKGAPSVTGLSTVPEDVNRELTPDARACALHTRAGLCLMWPISYFFIIFL